LGLANGLDLLDLPYLPLAYKHCAEPMGDVSQQKKHLAVALGVLPVNYPTSYGLVLIQFILDTTLPKLFFISRKYQHGHR